MSRGWKKEKLSFTCWWLLGCSDPLIPPRWWSGRPLNCWTLQFTVKHTQMILERGSGFIWLSAPSFGSSMSLRNNLVNEIDWQFIFFFLHFRILHGSLVRHTRQAISSTKRWEPWKTQYILSSLSQLTRFKLSQLICHCVGKHLKLLHLLFIRENMSSSDTRPIFFFFHHQCNKLANIIFSVYYRRAVSLVRLW